MKNSSKRKGRQSSQGLSRVKPVNKVIVIGQAAPIDGGKNLMGTPNFDAFLINGHKNDMQNVAARWRRTSSKMFSALRFSRASSVRDTKSSSSPTSEQAFASGAIKDVSTTSNQAQSPHIDTNLEFTVFEDDFSATALDGTVHGAVPASNKVRPLLNQEDTVFLRKSSSSPGPAYQVVHKLSKPFLNNNTIHKYKLPMKPTLYSLLEKYAFNDQIHRKNSTPQNSTNPSFKAYSSVPPSEPSTAKTSMNSNVPYLSSLQARDEILGSRNSRTNVPADMNSIPNKLMTIKEDKLEATPTVVTVETTANAKIFFETHFNSLLSSQDSPRSMRRRELESRLCIENLPAEQRQKERLKWQQKESDNLRQSRVLKSKTNGTTARASKALEGYEIIKVLGKGSFGVVRLVREKNPANRGGLLSQNVISNNMRNWKQRPCEELNSSRVNISNTAKVSSNVDQQSGWGQLSGKSKGEVFAMKVIRKSDMLRNSQEGHLRAERDFLVASEKSRWVVPLIASFQDATNLYLVMEYMVGGDFLSLLVRKDTLKEKKARWYVAEMILCVEEAHKLRWIHRDIKPDNFLITASGHLKISDFGLAFDGHWAHDQNYYHNHRHSLMERLGIVVDGDSIDRKEGNSIAAGMALAGIFTNHKERHEKLQYDGPSDNEGILQWRDRVGKRNLARSVVGTSQYMAPEVVRGDFYDGRCDWWSIGIILYECLYGHTPFVCANREDTKRKILDNANSLQFPPEDGTEKNERVSYQAMDLINSLLQEKEHRLCSGMYRLNDYQQSKCVPGRLVTPRVNKKTRDPQGHYVYPDDAADIKAHPFFHDLVWDSLHLSRPPFIPAVESQDDTRYFDDDDSISDTEDTSSDNVVQETLMSESPLEAFQVDGKQGWANRTMSALGHRMADEKLGLRKDGNKDVDLDAKAGNKKIREKKRPRDRMLRDKEVGRTVLELRKQGAFLGYTYRRPSGLFFEEDRGRHCPPRGGV